MFDRQTRLFLCFRDRGDPAALARLFDCTAPELLQLALHLCGNVADAEDALQATFLAAIQSAMRFERGKRVMPWLVGILTHHAMAEHRRRRRAPELGVDAGTVTTLADEPAACAHGHELNTTTRAAIDRLPEPYRQPTLLRLLHGMEPGDIALVLRRSPGTVRAQLYRGLERLRRLLPAGLATSFAIAALTGRGLAAVREVVLAEARRTAVATVAATAVLVPITGVVMSKKAIVGAATALCAALALGVWCVAREESPPRMPNDGRASVVSTTAANERAELPAPTLQPAEQRVAAAAPAVSTWALAVLVVDGPSGAPIPGARVLLHGPRSMTLLELQREFAFVAPPGRTGVPWFVFGNMQVTHDLPAEVLAGDGVHPFLVPPSPTQAPLHTATTDDSGHAVLAAPTSGSVLSVQHDGRGARSVAINTEPETEQRIELWPLRRVVGFVRTDDDTPLPGPLRLVLYAQEGSWATATDHAGRFTADIAAPRARVECVTHGFTVTARILGPNGEKWHGPRERKFDVPELFFVTRFAATRLHVTDAATKQPIEVIHLCSSDSDGYPIHCGRFVTDNGDFVLGPPTESSTAVDMIGSLRERDAASLCVWSPGYRAFETKHVPLLGKACTTIEVALERGETGAVTGQVTRGAEPVAGVRVQLRPVPRLQWNPNGRGVLASAPTAADGTFSLPVPSGDYVLEVFDGAVLAAQLQIASPTTDPLPVDLDDAIFVDVLVVDAKGVPQNGHNAAVHGVPGQNHAGRTDATGHVVLGPFQRAALQVMAPLEPAEGSWSGQVFADVAVLRPVLVFEGTPPPAGFEGFRALRTWPYTPGDPVPVALDGTVPIDVRPTDRVRIDAPQGRRFELVIPESARPGHTIPIRWSGLAYEGTLRNARGWYVGTLVRATPVDGADDAGAICVGTGQGGHFRLDGLAAVPHRLTFASRHDSGGINGQSFVTSAPPALPPVTLAIDLRSGSLERATGYDERTIAGRVVNAAGEPIAATIAITALLDQQGGVLEVMSPWQQTGADGRYQLTVARSKRYRASIWPAAAKNQKGHREEFTLDVPDNASRDFVAR